PRSSMFKRRLIAADQASVFMEMTSVYISSGLVLHQMTSDHNRSELGIQDHSNDVGNTKSVGHFQSCNKIMPPKVISEARMHEIIREQVNASMAEFVANMNHGADGAGAGDVGVGGARVGGAGPEAPEITGCTYMTFMKCDPHPSK
ncbi:hypothetical protein Tco_0057134, partial [Tanacetum coccineum]